MKVLITGIAGHLGSRLANWLLINVPSVEVYGVDDLQTGYESNIPIGSSWYHHTLGTFETGASPKLCHLGNNIQFDYVFHFAAYAAEGLSPFIRMYNYRNNLLATAEVINYCLRTKAQRLIFTSSMAAYGDIDPPFDEKDACYPIDPYGIAKRACEQDIQVAYKQHGLDYCIIRPHNVYGPYQDLWSPYRNVLGIWMSRHLRGMPIRIYGDGEQLRAFSYINDIVPCLWQAAINPKASRQVINLGGANPYRIQEVADMLPFDTEVEYCEPRHEVKYAWCTVAKSQQLLGYEDKTSLEKGLHEMWNWAQRAWREYPERIADMDSKHPDPEIETGLYSYWK